MESRKTTVASLGGFSFKNRWDLAVITQFCFVWSRFPTILVIRQFVFMPVKTLFQVCITSATAAIIIFQELKNDDFFLKQGKNSLRRSISSMGLVEECVLDVTLIYSIYVIYPFCNVFRRHFRIKRFTSCKECYETKYVVGLPPDIRVNRT